MKVAELLESEYDPNFKLLDASYSRPYTQSEVMVAMKQLHARVHRQAEHYGAEIDRKTGKLDNSKHKFFPAVIAHK
jgi:hypothetical protein